MSTSGEPWPTFPSPFRRLEYGEAEPQPKSLRELQMMKLSATIRRKPLWYEKMKNPEILDKWRQEAKTEGLTDNQVSYVMQELGHYASLRQPITGIEVSDVDGVWHSDTLIDEPLRKELLNRVAALEDVPVTKRDWHPGSRKQVLNLVHPSLYPVMYGKTRVIHNAKPALKYCSGGVEVATMKLNPTQGPCSSVTLESVQDEKSAGAEDEANDEESVSEAEADSQEIDHAADSEKSQDSVGHKSEEEDAENNFEIVDGSNPAENAQDSDPDAQLESETDEDESDDLTESENENSEPENGRNYWMSNKFSWLPTDFVINIDGTVKIASYINNLHPMRHAALYATVEKIFSKFIPLFENVLQDFAGPGRHRNRIFPVRDWYDESEYPGNDDSNSDNDSYAWEQSRTVNLPDAPSQFIPPEPVAADDRISLLGKTVQVIVKLANIVLTPEKPTFRGGVWHVEGMENEQIVASGIYYYDVENISKSELGFRQNVCEPDYEQGDHRGVREVYGLENDEPLNQYLGSVQTSQNRCLAFPNIYQHRVRPFKLQDPSKPGHRKILVFFLVNPGRRIISTSSVPPQQFDWFIEELYKIRPFSHLPFEIVTHIAGFLEWPLTLEKAKKVRRKLMNERKYFISKNNEEYFERPFSLCEH